MPAYPRRPFPSASLEHSRLLRPTALLTALWLLIPAGARAAAPGDSSPGGASAKVSWGSPRDHGSRGAPQSVWYYLENGAKGPAEWGRTRKESRRAAWEQLSGDEQDRILRENEPKAKAAFDAYWAVLDRLAQRFEKLQAQEETPLSSTRGDRGKRSDPWKRYERIRKLEKEVEAEIDHFTGEFGTYFIDAGGIGADTAAAIDDTLDRLLKRVVDAKRRAFAALDDDEKRKLPDLEKRLAAGKWGRTHEAVGKARSAQETADAFAEKELGEGQRKGDKSAQDKGPVRLSAAGGGPVAAIGRDKDWSTRFSPDKTKDPAALKVGQGKKGDPAADELEALKRKEAALLGASKLKVPVPFGPDIPVGDAAKSRLAEVGRERRLLETSQAQHEWLKNNKDALQKDYEREFASRHDALLAKYPKMDRDRAGQIVVDQLADKRQHLDRLREYDDIMRLPPDQRRDRLVDWQEKTDALMRQGPTGKVEGVKRDLQREKGGLDAALARDLDDPRKTSPRLKALLARDPGSLNEAERKEAQDLLDKNPSYQDYRRRQRDLDREENEADQRLRALRKEDPAYFKSREAREEYARHNRDNLQEFKDGTAFRPEELGAEPGSAHLTKRTRGGLTGLEYKASAGGQEVTRFEASDGSYARDDLKVKGRDVSVERHLKDGQVYATRMPDMTKDGDPVLGADGKPKTVTLLNPSFDYSRGPKVLPGGLTAKDIQAAQTFTAHQNELGRADASGKPAYSMVAKDGQVVVQGKDDYFIYQKSPDGKILREYYQPKAYGDRPHNIAEITPGIEEGKYHVNYKALTSDSRGNLYYQNRYEDWKAQEGGGFASHPISGWGHPEGVQRAGTLTAKDGFWDSVHDNPVYKYGVKPVGKGLGYVGRVAVEGTGGILAEAGGNVTQVAGGTASGAEISVRGHITRGKAVGLRSDEELVQGALEQVIDPREQREMRQRLIDKGLEREFAQKYRGADARDYQRYKQRFDERHAGDEDAKIKALAPHIVDGYGVKGGLDDLRKEGATAHWGANMMDTWNSVGQAAAGGQAVASIKVLAAGTRATQAIKAVEGVNKVTGKAGTALDYGELVSYGDAQGIARKAATKFLMGRARSADAPAKGNPEGEGAAPPPQAPAALGGTTP